jgi:Zn finger protein HypA/HybF involved in hydrogenase expression
MGAIKRTPADDAFSKCVRERANWTCERCGRYFPEGSRGGLDCSHHHSRGNWSIRFDPLNAEALCYGCHSHEGGTQQRREAVLTDIEQEILFEKMRDRDLGRMARKTKGKGEIAKHYRMELKRMQELRDQGEAGRIEFIGYF